MASLDTRSDILSHMLPVDPLPEVTPTYVQINIGRNVNGEPMPATQWARFQAFAEEALYNARIGRGIISIHTGCGAWQDENGITTSEDSAYISTFAAVDLDTLRTDLASLRSAYGQDAIALIVGSELI